MKIPFFLSFTFFILLVINSEKVFSAPCELNGTIDLRDTLLKDIPVRKQYGGTCFAHCGAQIFDAALQLEHKGDKKFKSWQTSAMVTSVNTKDEEKYKQLYSNYLYSKDTRTKDEHKTKLRQFLHTGGCLQAFQSLLENGACRRGAIIKELERNEDLYKDFFDLMSSFDVEKKNYFKRAANLSQQYNQLSQQKKNLTTKLKNDKNSSDLSTISSLQDQINIVDKKLNETLNDMNNLHTDSLHFKDNLIGQYLQCTSDPYLNRIKPALQDLIPSNYAILSKANATEEVFNGFKEIIKEKCKDDNFARLDPKQYKPERVIFIDKSVKKNNEFNDTLSKLNLEKDGIQQTITSLDQKLKDSRLKRQTKAKDKISIISPIKSKRDKKESLKVLDTKILNLEKDLNSEKNKLQQKIAEITQITTDQEKWIKSYDKKQSVYDPSTTISNIQNTKEALFDKLCTHFKSPNPLPVMLSYRSGIFYFGERFPTIDPDELTDEYEKNRYEGSHASPLIGMKKDENGKVMYLIRNSWGEDCSTTQKTRNKGNIEVAHHSKDIICDKGNLWVSEELFFSGLKGAVIVNKI
jgi:predicted  nucleic acid-binding Zn-ribbon protein